MSTVNVAFFRPLGAGLGLLLFYFGFAGLASGLGALIGLIGLRALWRYWGDTEPQAEGPSAPGSSW